MFKQQSGITLVALVITVIVLLILAGVSMSLITGNNGLFDKASTAATGYNEKAGEEANLWNNIMNEANAYMN